MPKAATDTLTLAAFRAASGVSGGNPDAGAPSRLVIAPLGRHDARQRGQVIVNDITLTGFAERQAAAKLGTRLALDFEHNTVPGTPAYTAEKEPRSIAAWATCSAVPGEGLVYHDIEWTPAGLQAWKDKLFQDLSPAVFRREDGTVIALHSVALCRHGEIDGLTIESATRPELAPFFAALSASLSPQESESIMKPTPALIALLAALGTTLAPEADEAAVTKALEDTTAKVNAAKEEEKPEVEGMSAKITELTGKITTLSADMKAVKDERDQIRRDALMQQAAHEGKVIPLSAEVLKVTPLAVLEDLVKTAKPGEVPTQSQQNGNGQGEGAGKVEAFSAETLAVMESMGTTPEEVAKYAPKLASAAATNK